MNIALIAHDSKKKLMQNFCIAYRGILNKHTLHATGTTGRLIEEATNLTVCKYLAGHLGGEQQLGSEIETNQIDMLIFLRDPFGGLGLFRDDLDERTYQRHFMHRIETSFLNLLKAGCRNARHCGSPRIIRSTDYLKIFGLAVNYSLSPVKSNRVPRWMRSLAKNLLVSR